MYINNNKRILYYICMYGRYRVKAARGTERRRIYRHKWYEYVHTY